MYEKTVIRERRLLYYALKIVHKKSQLCLIINKTFFTWVLNAFLL